MYLVSLTMTTCKKKNQTKKISLPCHFGLMNKILYAWCHQVFLGFYFVNGETLPLVGLMLVDSNFVNSLICCL